MEIVILAILILLNGFFALSEIAMVSSKRSRLEQRVLKGSNGAKVALKLLDKSESFLSAIQVGITLIGIVTGAYGGISIAEDVAPFFESFPLTQKYASQIALVITVIIITYFSIVIGELVPKTIALNNPDKIAVRVAPIIYFFSSLFYPFVIILSVSTSFVNKLIGIRKQSDVMTEAELRQMIKTASTEGIIEKEQNIMHEKVFYFANKRAKHLMTHRLDVEWIDIDNPAEEIIARLQGAQHSKLICCHGSLDNFKGILYLRDFYKQNFETKDFNIDKIIIEPLIVPENISAHKVLDLFRQNKIHICCVVNEYGGFEGIITLHDIVENIVGEIPEEGEIYEPDVFIREDKTVVVSGDASIEILNEIILNFDVDFDKIDYSTVAGFVFNQFGRIPQVGDSFEYMGYKIEIVDMDGAMIEKVLISRIL